MDGHPYFSHGAQHGGRILTHSEFFKILGFSPRRLIFTRKFCPTESRSSLMLNFRHSRNSKIELCSNFSRISVSRLTLRQKAHVQNMWKTHIFHMAPPNTVEEFTSVNSSQNLMILHLNSGFTETIESLDCWPSEDDFFDLSEKQHRFSEDRFCL